MYNFGSSKPTNKGYKMRNLAIIALAVSLAACSSPPKPPTVDGSKRSGINDTETASVLSMKAELAEMKQRVTDLETRPMVAPPPPPPVSQTVTVHFPFNSANFRPSAAQEAALLPLLAKARRVEIRGRTDGIRPGEGDEQIAMKRAKAAMNYVVSKGVPATAVSLNFLSAGDYIADNRTDAGRATNRRVEIEVFNR